MCCLGCRALRAPKDDESELDSLDLCVVDAGERSLKLGFYVPRMSTVDITRRCWSNTRRRVQVDFKVSILGGPSSDYLGPREERMTAHVLTGSRIEHDITDLLPQTEYTVLVTAELRIVRGGEMESHSESLEVRTADAIGAQVAREDWSSPAMSSSRGYEKGDELSGSKKAKAGDGLAPEHGIFAGMVPRCDENSTVAPSDVGGNDGRHIDGSSECSDAGGVSPRSPLDSTVAAEDNRNEVSCVRESLSSEVLLLHSPRGYQIQCDLCSMLDCWKPQEEQSPRDDPTEIIFETEMSSARAGSTFASSSVPPSRDVRRQESPREQPRVGFNPYRIPFPGTPVDAASVGLASLERQNEHLFDACQLRHACALASTRRVEI